MDKAIPIGQVNAMTTPLLDIRELTCTRGGLPVVTNVSLTLSAGQALILMGPNGSGKTTLLRTVAGLQPPLDGEVIAASDAVAYAGHADGIKSTLTVTENLGFWAALFGTSGIEDALVAFDLSGLRDRMAGTLSAGQKRRLGLARLLVTGRPVWILDEPTVSLDATSVALFANAVRAHLERGGAALIATHIDLGLDAATLELTGHRAVGVGAGAFDEAFL